MNRRALMIHRLLAAVLCTLCASGPPARLAAQSGQTVGNANWTQPFPAFRMIGNVYWVGTADVSTYLVTTREGHILINTGLKATVPQIAAGVTQLGFKMADVKVLTATHGHWDHVAGLAELARMTKAQVVMAEADAQLLESGGRTDFRWGADPTSHFDRVTVDRRLKDGDRITLGEVTLTAHHHPGHTKGATSFTFDLIESGKTYRVGIMNIGSINPGVTVAGMPMYPEIAADYAKTFTAQKALVLDVYLASHAGQFRMHDKYKPGDPYSATRFVDPGGYQAAVEQAERAYLAQLAKERGR
jgi:metallo-beta-lactamase class B